MKKIVIVSLFVFAILLTACADSSPSDDITFEEGSLHDRVDFPDGASAVVEITTSKKGIATYTSGKNGSKDEYARVLGILMFFGDVDIDSFIVTINSVDEDGVIIFDGGEFSRETTMPNYSVADINTAVADEVTAELVEKFAAKE